MRALAASALTMVAWLEHPHLTLLLLTPLLRQIREMSKKAKTETTTMSEASRRPTQHFLVLNDKGEKYQIKFEGLALLCSVLFYLEKLDCPILQIRLSGFAQQNFSSIFSPLVLVDLKNICNM
jgi:hypothetical protein